MSSTAIGYRELDQPEPLKTLGFLWIRARKLYIWTKPTTEEDGKVFIWEEVRVLRRRTRAGCSLNLWLRRGRDRDGRSLGNSKCSHH